MPDRILLSALDAKWADHECIALWLALANVEVRSSEWCVALLSTMCDQHDGAHAVSAAYLDILDQVLGVRGLVDAEDGSKQHHGNIHAERVALTASATHVAQIQYVIGPRVSCRQEEDGAGMDPFHRYREDLFDRYSEGQSSNEGTEDGEPRSPTRTGSPVSSE